MKARLRFNFLRGGIAGVAIGSVFAGAYASAICCATLWLLALTIPEPRS